MLFKSKEMHKPLQPTIVIRYWGRKAGGIAEPYLYQYSKDGSIVLDPFGGAGSIIKTALALDRRAIYIDANPLAALIARVEIEGVDATELSQSSAVLLENPKFLNFYQIQCKCGSKADVLYFLCANGRLQAAKIKCQCGCSFVELGCPDISFSDYPCDFPSVKLWYDNGKPFLKRRQVDHIYELFSPRNLMILSSLLAKIKEIRVSERTKRGLYLAFASILYQSSKMSRLGSGSWGINSYWLPQMHVERNPYALLKNALIRLSHIKTLALAVEDVKTVIRGEERAAILNEDAKKLPLHDNSVDMVITDPPFTDEIQYFELSVMAASWLNLSLPFQKEIIVNHNQGKSINDYYRLLFQAFSEMYRVLKKHGTAVIMLHDESLNVILSLAELIESAGFQCIKKETKQMIQRHVGDRDKISGKNLYILTCKKG